MPSITASLRPHRPSPACRRIASPSELAASGSNEAPIAWPATSANRARCGVLWSSMPRPFAGARKRHKSVVSSTTEALAPSQSMNDSGEVAARCDVRRCVAFVLTIVGLSTPSLPPRGADMTIQDRPCGRPALTAHPTLIERGASSDSNNTTSPGGSVATTVLRPPALA